MAAGRAIVIAAGNVAVEAQLNESKTATAIWDVLPIDATGETWGDEIYFDIGLAVGPESPRDVVEVGDLGYWPPGHAFCVFFGPTPLSRGAEIRPASPVNLIGRVVGDAQVFRRVSAGTRVTLRRAP